LLLGAFAAKTDNDKQRAAPSSEVAAGSADTTAPLSSKKRVTMADVQEKLAGGLKGVSFTAEQGYSSGDWSDAPGDEHSEGEESSSDSDSVSARDGGTGSGSDSEEGVSLGAAELEDLMFGAMTQTLRVTVTDREGNETSKVVTVRGEAPPPTPPH
jgi:hypothetical protein